MSRPVNVFILVAVLLIVYLNSLQNTFVYDDVFTITDNYFIRDWSNFFALFTHDYFQSSGEVTYRPVVTLSYFIDYSIWRLNPFGFHLTNILLHAVNGVLVYILLSMINKDRAIPFVATILFVLHPVLTEAVNGISYREDLLTTTFFLGSILLFIQSTIRNPQSAVYNYPLSLLLYLLALCSKEMAITLPPVVFLMDLVFGGKNRIKKNILRYYPGFILVSGFYLFLRFVWLHNPAEKQLLYPDNSFLTNLLTMPKVLSSYVKLLFFPISFNAEYIIAHTKTPVAAVFICSMVFLGVIGVITYKCYRLSGYLFFFILWFFVTLSPMMNILPIANIMAERYLYLPSIGFCTILACILAGVWKYTQIFFSTGNIMHSGCHSKDRRCFSQITAVVFLMLLLIVPYSLFTVNRSSVWRDPFTFWLKTTEDSPDSSRARNNLGMIYLQKGKTDLAIHEFQTAIAIEPDPEYHHNLGMAYQNKGMREKALQEYGYVLAVNPNSALTHNNMGNILIDKGYIDEGISKFKEAIRIKPNYYDAHYNLGLAYFKKGLLDASIEEFKLAIRYEPDHAEAHSCLGTAYANKGLFDEAIAEMEEALRRKPNYPNVCKNLGIVYLDYRKDIQKALHFFREFLRLDPANPEAEMVRKTVEELQVLR